MGTIPRNYMLLVTDDGDGILNGDNNGNELHGGRGADELAGFGGEDILVGGVGEDIINGGADDDRIVGGLDDDILTGGSGSDTFVFDQAVDNDVVTDFLSGVDVNDISALLRQFDYVALVLVGGDKDGADMVLDYADTLGYGASSVITIAAEQVGADTVLSFSNDDPVVGAAFNELGLTVTLENVTAASLTMDDFFVG